jgi:hypothetical protein
MMTAPNKMQKAFGQHVTQQNIGPLTVYVAPFPDDAMAHVCLAMRATVTDSTQLGRLDVLQACWPDLSASADLEDSGGVVSASREKEWLLVEMTAPVESVDTMLEVCRSVLDNKIDEVLVSSARRKVAARTASSVHAATDPAFAADVCRWEGAFGIVPAIMGLPSQTAVLETDTSDIASTAHDLFAAGDIHLVVVGDVDPADIVRHARALGAGITAGDRAASVATPTLLAIPTIRIKNSTEYRRTCIRLMSSEARVTDARKLLSRAVLAVLLGGTPQARLGRLLRDDLGIAYDVSASLTRTLGTDTILVNADVANDAAQEAIDRINGLLLELAEHGPGGAESDRAIEFLSGSYLSAWSTVVGRALFLTMYITNDMPVTDIARVGEVLFGLTGADIAAAGAVLHPAKLAGGIVGGFRELRTGRS